MISIIARIAKASILLYVNIKMSSTVLTIGNKNVTLKYTRKMPRGEVERMKSFVTKNGDKLMKTQKFKVLSQVDEGTKRVFKVVL